jgi:hypothetical protein
MTRFEERLKQCQPSVVHPRSFASTLRVLLSVAGGPFEPVYGCRNNKKN